MTQVLGQVDWNALSFYLFLICLVRRSMTIGDEEEHAHAHVSTSLQSELEKQQMS